MVYKSKNELHTFYLHDCTIENINIKDRDMSLTLDYVNVLKDNSQNHNTVAMQTDKAVIFFCHYKVTKAIRLFDLVNGKQNIEPIVALNTDELTNILTGKQIFSCDIDIDNTRFDILCDEYTLVLDIQFENVCVKWDEFVRQSWFE